MRGSSSNRPFAHSLAALLGLALAAPSDPETGAVLTDPLADGANTGEISVANGPSLDSALPREIAGTDFLNEGPVDEVLSANTVQENAADGTVVGAVTGSDPDAGAVLTYSLTDDAGGRFAIDAASGVITVANGNLLDFEAASSHGISVRVSDEGGLFFDKDFTIAVTDVNEAPVAVGDHVTTNEDTALVLAASALTANDGDPDGDVLTVTAVGNATHGTVSLVDGNITFTPDANFSGIARFDYTASDGRGGSTTATVTVDVAPVADAPTLQATQFMHAVRKSAGEFLVNTATLNGQLNPSVTALTNGNFVVTWEDNSGQGGDAAPASIKAQIFNAAGAKVGGEFLVNTATASTQRFPSVTGLTNGSFVVTWEDSSGAGGDASGDSIKAQVFDATGAKVGGEVLVNTATANSQANPSITALTNGGFVVAWEDNSLQGGDASGTSIKAQMFDASGAKVGGEVLVNTTTQNGQIAPAITALAGGGFVATWSDASGQGGDASGFGIKAQLFNATGGKAGGEFLVNTATLGDQSTPSITALSTGGFIVAWNDGSGQGGDASSSSIKAQIFNAAGGKVGGEKLVNTITLGPQRFPSITALSNGWFVVTWEDSSGVGGDASFDSIKAQVYDGNGAAIGVEFLVNTTTVTTQVAPSVAALANGSFVVTWQDQSGVGGDTSAAGIKAQIFALASTNEDTPMSLSVTSALTDTDGSETLALAVSSIPVGATLSDGVHTFTATAGNTSADISGWTLSSLTLTPPLNFNGDFQLTFTATATDTATLSTGAASSTHAVTQTINVSVTPVNDAPVAVADHFTASEDTPLNIPMALLTGNDTDVDGDVLTVTTDGTATHGSTVISNGIVTFRPTANYSGIAQFTYTVSDGQGGSATATATVDVAPVADSPTLQASAVGAQRIGGEFLVNTRTVGDQANPSITALANGNFVVTWDDNSGQGGDASGAGIKAQILDAAGSKVGGEFLVNTVTASSQFLSSVAALTSGGFIVAWSDISGVGGDTSGLGVKAQIFDAAGSKVGGEFLVNTTTVNNQSNPSVTGLTNGNFVVTWEDSTGDASSVGVKAQIFNATGGKVGGEFLVNTATLFGQNVPSIKALADGAFVVTWDDSSGQGGDASGGGIKAQIFDATGAHVGGEFLVNTTTLNSQANPSVTVLSNGNFVVTWEDGSGQGGDASGLSTKAQIFNASGGKVGSEFRVNTTTLNSQSVPSITALTNGSFVVTWEDASGQGGDASPDSIKAQVFDASGNKQGGEFLVNTATLNSQRTPSITALANGAFVVTWADASAQGGDTSGFGIKAQIFMVATDNQNTLVPLNVAAALTDTDGSETLAVTASSIPVGAILTDGVHTFTASTGSTSVDITSWALINLGITPPPNFAGNLQLAFSATATDHATLSTGAASDTKTVTQTVNVNVLPVNGVTDEVLSANTVQENAANGTVVGTVTGADLNPGAVLTYALTNDAGGRFAIDAATGVITVANGSLLDFETATSHGIAVQVTDQFGFSFNKLFTVNLTNVNEAPANEVLSGGTVAENASNNTVVGTVTGSGDPDAGAVLTYSLTDNAGGRFAINATSGVITVANGTLLNFETAISHGITARVTDQDGLFFDKNFTITVSNVNEAPTNEVLTDGTVAENAANGTVVGTVTGSDQDAGSVLTYSLTNNAGGRFAINATSGVITVANGTLLNFEASVSQTIGVRVTDQGGLFFDKNFTIAVTNVNEAPTNEVLSFNQIAENAANGAVVGTVTGSDPDAGGVLTYSLTDNAGGRFAINANTGQITVANGTLLNFETATSHGITARVTDQGGLFFDKNFTINVSNVNEAPTNEVLTDGTVAENAANGTVVGTITGSGDPDAGAVLTYSLTDNAGGRFAINANTGVITVANGALLNFEAAPSQTITARVSDQGGLFFDKNFTITVSNVNEAPTNEVLSFNQIAENAANGAVVGTVTGSGDPDAGAVLTYSLTNDAGGRFAINATTGVITVANGALLDFDTAPSQTITARVTDQGGLFFDKSFTIALTNVNEAPTNAVLSGSGTIAENAANGSVVGTVTGSDPDAGSVLTYTLLDNAGGRFAVNANTGVITVANGTLLNFETAPSHGITARVTDQGGLFFDKNFTITVSNVNEAPTDAVLDNNTVQENSPAGRVVGTVTGVDPDAGSVLTYALTNNAGGRFAIDATTGVITVATDLIGTHASLDFELAKTHDVTVQVTDQGGLSFTKTLTINVVDVNERPTDELLSANTVQVDAANGTVIGTVTSIDPDVGEDVLTRYTIVDSQGNPVVGGPFAIDPATGVLTVADRTQLATAHQVTVRATDKGFLTFDKTFPINVTSVKAVADHFTTNEDTPLVIPGPIMTANDIDPNHRATVTAVGNASHGTVVVSNGVVTFTPDAHYSGAAQFDYTISDGQGGTSTATDTIDVAPNLKAVADHIGAREDGPVLLSAASLTANDTNTGGALTLTAVGNASHGTVALVNGDVHFTPDHDFSGIAQFDYTVNNAQGDTSTATVTLDVAPIADDPTLSVHQIVGAGEPGNAFEMGVSSGIVLGQTVVATLKNGDCVAVWFDSTDQHHADTLKAQMFDSNGHERGGAFVVEIAPSGTGIIGMFGTGLLVALSNGGFAVTWADISNDATTLNAKIFDANGHETAGIIPIAARSRSGIGDLFTTFQSATLTNDRFVVEWVMTERFDDETPQVMAQVFGSDGGAVSGQILLDQFAKITGLANGRFVTVWSVSSQGTVENRAQIYDGNGTKIGGEILLSQGGQGFTLITASNAGGFLAWNGSTAQLFDSIGTKIGGELHLGDNSISVQSITALANGNYVVGGIKATGPLTESIIAQVFNRSGQKVGEFAIPTGFGVVYSTNSIAALPDGGFVVGWSDEELSPSGVRLHNRVQIFPPAAATAAAMNTPVPVNVAAALTDTDGSETLKVEVSGIPVGTTLSDGTHTFTVTDGRASVDISDWSFGSLTVTPPLDFRGDLQVTFTATSTDTATLSTGPASDTTSVTQIIDILIAPEGSLDHNTVAENSPNGTVVGAFIPDVSPDVAAGFTYELVNDAGGRFALSGNVISVANNDLIDATYTVTVRTTNPADGTTFDNSVTINVNRAPTGATVVGGSIAASDMDGHMVATVTGIDPDPGDSLVYSLVDNIFAIDPTLGIITLIDREALDFNLTSYVVTVRITDQFQQSVLVPVTLTLEPDQAPTGATLDTNTVDDNAKQGDAVVRVQGSDPDIMDTLIYDFADGGDAGGLFDIDRATGIITVANEALLAATTASSVGIIVRVSDGLRSVDQHLTIHVNHAPALVTLSNDTVRTAENGASVAQVIGLDFDGDTLHYAFVNNDGGTSALSADGTYAISANGVITVNDATLLDGSPKDVVVRTMDPRGRFVDDHFTIKDDTNHAPTGASLPDFTVPDNAPNGTPVGTVVGEDPDNDVLHYAFVDNTGGTSALSADGTFAISANGVITVNDGTLLNEAAKDIIVRITDPHGLSFDQPLTIIVTGHSDTPSLQAPASELSGGSGEGVVNGTAGNDTLSGGGGSDTYVFGSGFGQTTIHNLAQDGLTVPRGEIDFGTGVSNQNLWFEQKGNDLQIDRIGTQSHITVAGWYGSDPRAQVQSINAPDGSLLNSQVQQLVSAMAAYVGSHPGFDPTTATQAPQGDANLQAAIGAAWHH